MKALLAAVFAALVLAPAALASHPAGLYTTTEQVATMDDGVGIATTLYTPVTHGERSPGRDALPRRSARASARSTRWRELFAQRGYIALTFDFRGHGQSGGLFSGLGARELLDVARLRESWLPANAPLDGDKVGAFGISLGGGAVLRAAGEGTPFKALEVVETWTDLYEALVPQDLPKSGAIFQFLGAVPANRQAPELLALRDSVANRDLPTLRAFAEARSSRQLLARGYPPTLFFQGRRDFVFGLEQGIAGWQRHSGPKAIYFGAFGHSPSTLPGPDFELLMQRALQWFDVHVTGTPDTPNRPAVELADESGTTVRAYAGAAADRPARLLAAGHRDDRRRGQGRPPCSHDATASRRSGLRPSRCARLRRPAGRTWSRCSSPARRAGREIVVSEGGMPTSLTAKPKLFTIRLISQATRIPAGSRLELTLAGTSTAQNGANLLYLVPVPQRARITLRNVSLTIPALRTPVSR